MKLEQVIVICKTHFDIGYTHRVKDLVDYYRTEMIDKALAIMDQSASLPSDQQFAWTAPGWVMAKVLGDWPGQTDERRMRLEAAVRSGKFVTHALPFTFEAEFMEPEDLARSYAFSSLVSKKYARPLPRDAKMTDVPSHGGVLATALAQAGVKFMHIGCNWPSGYVKYPPLFWWEGPDGSRVLTMYSCIYGTSTALWPPRWLGKQDPGIGHNLMPPAGWPHKTWAAIIVTPDNSGPPGADAIKALFDEACKEMPGVKVRMGRMEDFADAIIAENPDLPVVKKEAPDTWIHGIMCDPGGVRTARNIRPQMSTAEALNTQLRTWGLALPDPAQELYSAFEQSLLYSEHTWGGAARVQVYGAEFQKLPPAELADLEGSWEDKTDYIRTAAKIVTPLLAGNLAALANAVDCGGPRIVVYNPLPWRRSGMVSVKTPAVTLQDISTGKSIPVQNGCFLATDIPASGYKTYPLEKTPGGSKSGIAAQSDAIENECFKVRLDPAQGSILSFIDKRTGREWADGSAAFGLGQYLNERFDADQTNGYCRDYQQGRALDTYQPGEWLHHGMSKPGLPGAKEVPYRAASAQHGRLRIDRDALQSTATMDFAGDPAQHLPASTLRISLIQAQPYLDLQVTIRDKAKDNWPEADWLCLPFKMASPKFSVGRALGIMDPADIIAGANRHLYAVGTGVTLTDADGSGIGLCSPDAPLISLDTPGCWKFSLDFVPKKPVVFLNLYNNQWNTNYRYWYPGTWSTRIRLWTFAKNNTTGTSLIIPSLETRNPLLAAAGDGPGGVLPSAQAGIMVSRPGVLVTAFGTNPDGQGTLLRVWEHSGVSGKLTVDLPAGAKAAIAMPVNLRGEQTGKPIKVAAGKFHFMLKAYAPASFILTENPCPSG